MKAPSREDVAQIIHRHINSWSPGMSPDKAVASIYAMAESLIDYCHLHYVPPPVLPGLPGGDNL
ncbi:hypothetical protein [Novosphingobium sp.]|jgi:hypothetical protein|uniref:hypothetical protein n=1 Tax=Novosphingobium sp. TaxID=1874826 RepID=UPI002FDF3867